MFNSPTKDTSSATEDGLYTAAHDAGQKVRHYLDSAGEDISNASSKVTHEIRNHPVRSSAIALGIGVVLGALLRR